MELHHIEGEYQFLKINPRGFDLEGSMASDCDSKQPSHRGIQ